MGELRKEDLDAIVKGEKETTACRMADGGGLYVEVRQLSQGVGLYWRYDYRTKDGKRPTLTIGKYPAVSVTQARKLHRAAVAQVDAGIDPAAAKARLKQPQKPEPANNFEAVAREWLGLPRNRLQWGEATAANIARSLELHVYPHIGNKQADTVQVSDIIQIINRIVEAGHVAHASTILNRIKKIFRHAVTTGRAGRNPADIEARDIIPPRMGKHFPALTDPDEIAGLLHDIDQFTGHYQTRALFRLSALWMLRPTEIRTLLWSDVDFDKKQIMLDASRLKNRRHVKEANLPQHRHIIPLSNQAMKILQNLRDVIGGKTLFPAGRGTGEHLSNSTLFKALEAMGYSGKMSGHGFRAMASSCLNAMRTPEGLPRWNPDAIERQLAHRGGDVVRNAYNRSDYLEERREMMQAWADYLDGLLTTYRQKDILQGWSIA